MNNLAKLEEKNRLNIASTLRTLSDAIESGEVEKYSILQDKYTTTIQVNTSNGEKHIHKNVNINGFQEQSHTISTPMIAKERKEVVKNLYINNRLTQQEIANRLNISQKTVSNDLKR